MGVASGMPADPRWLPLLVDELPRHARWLYTYIHVLISTSFQVIAIGREEVWPLLRECVRLGGNVRTGLEDTFYLPTGRRATTR